MNGQVVRADPLAATDIEREYGIRASTVRKWRQLGRLRPVGFSRGRGHAALYSQNDIEVAIAGRERIYHGVGGAP